MNIGGFTHAKHLGTRFTSNGKHSTGHSLLYCIRLFGMNPKFFCVIADLIRISLTGRYRGVKRGMTTQLYFLRAGAIIITIWRPSSLGMDST